MSDNKPLWQVMHEAAGNSNGFFRNTYAAEIRAIADWLVPEEDGHDFTPGSVAEIHWRERRALRWRLLAEADRAERGEGDPLPSDGGYETGSMWAGYGTAEAGK